MARRKSSIFEDLFDITLRLPWYVGIFLALLSYFIFQSMAITTNPSLRVVASLFQYILPIVFLLASLLSAINAGRKRAIFNKQSSLETIKQLSWREFEELVGEYYRRNNYTVTESEAGPDGGVDLILTRDGETTLVQCKHWKKSKVGVSIIREIFGVMKADNADHAVVVTTGTFTRDAEDFANKNDVDLISGNSLLSLIGYVKKIEGNDTIQVESPEMMICPRCNSPMVKRVARKGSNAGQEFWGCSEFPRCRGTRDI